MPKPKLSKGCSSRGADMGRASFLQVEHTGMDFKARLWEEKLIDGGYDSGGAYWGCREGNNKLYMAQAPGFFATAEGRYREEAADKIRAYAEKQCPGIKVRFHGIPLDDE